MTGDGKIYLALGLMSGTSRDGIDAALVRTDGETFVEPGPALSRPYDAAFKARLAAGVRLAAIEGHAAAGALSQLETDLTRQHVWCIEALLKKADIASSDVDIVGFHGHTMAHDPARGFSWQLGDGKMLAAKTGIDVIADFRRHDVAAKGEGAPLAPAYHRARLSTADKARIYVVLNIGGVSNVTWINPQEDRLLAFDCGPGNALIDDWVANKTGAAYDEGGRLAQQGVVSDAVVEQVMTALYFSQKPPKSLDRDAFNLDLVSKLSVEDGAATLSAITISAITAAQDHFPKPADCWYVTGGGRHNNFIINGLKDNLTGLVEPVDVLGWRGDYLEAEAFAYLAVRNLKRLPISWPDTTGVESPQTGGVLFRA